MSFTPDSTSSGKGTYTATPTPVAHTVGAGGNRILVVGVAISVAGDGLTSVTYGGVALTRALISGSSGVGCYTYLYYLLNPTVGTANVVVTCSDTFNSTWVAQSFFADSAIDAITVFNSTQGNGVGPFSLPIAATGKLAVSVIGGNGGTGNGGAGANEFVATSGGLIAQIDNSDNTSHAALSAIANVTSVGWSWGGDYRFTSMGVMVLSHAAGADTTAPILSSPTATPTGATTANGSVSTNETGTLWRLASTNPSETAATIKAAALTSSVTATGVQSVAFAGLTTGLTYYPHYVQDDAASPPNTSAVSNGAAFVPTASVPTVTFTYAAAGKNTNGGKRLAVAHRVTIHDKSTRALLGTKTGLTSDATTGLVTFTMAGFTAGTEYMAMAISDANDKDTGFFWITPA